MKITMVGTGYVGLVTGTCFANIGNDVTCLDVDQNKINKLNSGKSPIYEPGLGELIASNTAAGRLKFTTDKQIAYQSAQIIFLCVGTPSDANGQTDLKYVLDAAVDIGRAIENNRCDSSEKNELKTIVVKSTVPVGTNAKIKAAIAGQTQKPFHMASNPEFLKEGAAINDFERPDRVVVGVENQQTANIMHTIYEPFVRQGNPIFIMDIPSAEMVKYAANAMLATKISFINEIASLCEAYGSNIEQVRLGMCADSRIGNKFLYPGLGYGGSCFPKDVQACISMGKQAKTPTALLQAVHDVNQNQRQTFFEKIEAHFGKNGFGTTKIAIWGVAFKPGTDDVREAPAISIIQQLQKNGAKIVAHDPVARDTAQVQLSQQIEFTDSPYGAVDGADALVVCTDWPQYMKPDFNDIKQRMAQPIIFDGRNLYHPKQLAELGFTYHSVGRQTLLPSAS